MNASCDNIFQTKEIYEKKEGQSMIKWNSLNCLQ